ncbi:MAG: hypothetical protein IPO67_03680 [Deltaproteobacteria bacterium]|nr:hypothetical protein [Deltaproteobacteria bacterium]
MPRFQVRTADGQRQIDDVEELRRLSRIGVVRRDDPVSVDGGAWQRADALPALAGCFDVDLWDAWDGEDDEAKPAAPPLPADSLQVKTSGDRAPRPPVVVSELVPEDVPVVAVPVMPVAAPTKAVAPAPVKPSLVKTPPQASPPSPPAPVKPSLVKAPPPDPVKAPPSRPAAASRPPTPPPPPEPLVVEALEPLEPLDEPIELPLASVEPLPVVTRVAAAGGAVGRGQVIRFPAGKVPAPAPKTEPSSPERGRRTPSRPLEREPGPPAPPLVAGPRLSLRWLGYLALFAVAGLSIWGFTAYVDSLAGYTPAPGRPVSPTPGAPAAPGGELVEAPEAPAPPAPRPGDDPRLNAMRVAIGGDVPVTPPDADRLQDLLYLELQRIAPARDVRIEVVRESNDRRRSPELVKAWFSVNTRGDLPYELGAVGLVAGKYQARTELEFQEIVALLVEEDGTVRQRSLSPGSALKLYRAELDLTTFLLADVPAPSEAPAEPPPAEDP